MPIQKGAYIETAGDYKLRINDSQKFVKIETKGVINYVWMT